MATNSKRSNRARVLTALKKASQPVTAAELAEQLTLKPSQVAGPLSQLSQGASAAVVRVSPGRYTLRDSSDATSGSAAPVNGASTSNGMTNGNSSRSKKKPTSYRTPPAKTARNGQTLDLRERVARTWSDLFGVAMTADDVELALQVADRIRARP